MHEVLNMKVVQGNLEMDIHTLENHNPPQSFYYRFFCCDMSYILYY